MGVTIGSTAGYLYLDTWVLANIIQLATVDFCKTFLNNANDPGGRQYAQMTQAARSVTANIAEGSSRHQTSRETEMQLLDVARASLSELSGDYLFYLLDCGTAAWSQSDPRWTELHSLRLDRPQYSNDLMHDVSLHLMRQKARFDNWLLSPDSAVRANALLLLCGRLIRMLYRQIDARFNEFKGKGGFRENLTQDRLAARTAAAASADAPSCPKCGKPMLKRTAKAGINSGKQFWSCSDYPRCNGTRKLD